MPGKPYQSLLAPFEDQVSAWRDAGLSYRRIAETLARERGVRVTHNAVFSFLRTRVRQSPRFFSDGLSPDLREQLVRQLAVVWTHGSTAIEGNTLSLGDTFKVLELGLTIGGKPLREHQEVYGHARAIELAYGLLARAAVTEDDLFAIHKAVMPLSPVDALNPVGGWKQRFNGTTGLAGGRQVFMEYAHPLDVPALMRRWLGAFNRTLARPLSAGAAARAYAEAHLGFVRVHPFFDGNGRVARLVANLPALRWGYPPVVIPSERREDYIGILWEYEQACGPAARDAPLVPPHPAVARFTRFVREAWRGTLALVEDFRKREASRAEGPRKNQ
jgi:TolB-like protein